MSDIVSFGTTFLPYLHLKFTSNDIFFHIFLVNNSIQLFANSETNKTLLYDISYIHGCPVIIQKNAFQSADSERFRTIKLRLNLVIIERKPQYKFGKDIYLSL